MSRASTPSGSISSRNCDTTTPNRGDGKLAPKTVPTPVLSRSNTPIGKSSISGSNSPRNSGAETPPPVHINPIDPAISYARDLFVIMNSEFASLTEPLDLSVYEKITALLKKIETFEELLRYTAGHSGMSVNTPVDEELVMCQEELVMRQEEIVMRQEELVMRQLVMRQEELVMRQEELVMCQEELNIIQKDEKAWQLFILIHNIKIYLNGFFIKLNKSLITEAEKNSLSDLEKRNAVTPEEIVELAKTCRENIESLREFLHPTGYMPSLPLSGNLDFDTELDNVIRKICILHRYIPITPQLDADTLAVKELNKEVFNAIAQIIYKMRLNLLTSVETIQLLQLIMPNYLVIFPTVLTQQRALTPAPQAAGFWSVTSNSALPPANNENDSEGDDIVYYNQLPVS